MVLSNFGDILASKIQEDLGPLVVQYCWRRCGEVENFQSYCPFREKWLTFVNMLDVEASLLLASNASSAVPRDLQNESGWCGQQDLQHSSIGSSKLNRKLNGAALIKAKEDCTNNINKVANLMATLVEQKTSPPPSNVVMSTPVTVSSTPPTKKKQRFVDCIDDVRRFREHEQEIKEDTGVSPTTKEMILNRIQKEKKKVINNATTTDDE